MIFHHILKFPLMLQFNHHLFTVLLTLEMGRPKSRRKQKDRTLSRLLCSEDPIELCCYNFSLTPRLCREGWELLNALGNLGDSYFP